MRIFKNFAVFFIVFFSMTVVPRNIWFYTKCKQIRPVCSACCEETFSIGNTTLILPDSTTFSKSITFHEKYGIHAVSRYVWDTDSTKGRMIFSHIVDSPSVSIDGRSFFKSSTSNTYFIKGLELVREDFKVSWVAAFANPLYPQKKFMKFIENFEKNSGAGILRPPPFPVRPPLTTAFKVDQMVYGQ